MAAPTDVKEIREAGVTNQVTAATRSADVRILLATPPTIKDETITPEELFSGFTWEESVIAARQATLGFAVAANSRGFGINQYGRILRQKSATNTVGHFTVAGNTVTLIDDSVLDGEEVTWFFKPANPVTNPVDVRGVVNDPPTTINLDTTHTVFIVNAASGTNFTANGSHSDITIVNDSGGVVRYYGVELSDNSTSRFVNRPGVGWVEI